VASETFSREVNFTTLKLGILLHEVVEECVEIVCDCIFTPSERTKLFNKTEASSQRLVNIHNISFVVPGEWIIL